MMTGSQVPQPPDHMRAVSAQGSQRPRVRGRLTTSGCQTSSGPCRQPARRSTLGNLRDRAVLTGVVTELVTELVGAGGQRGTVVDVA